MGRGPRQSRRQPPSARRADRARRRNQRSDLGARVLVAIPAIVFAIVIVAQGGLVFTLGLIALGVLCLHELYGMLERVRPLRLAGFLGLAGMLLAAQYGDQFQILLVLACTVPVMFFMLATRPPGQHGTLAAGVTMLGLVWVGVALAHAVLLRELPHGDGIVVDVLVGTFIGDTGAYLGGRAFGRRKLAPSISPNKTVEGLVAGFIAAVVATWFAGLYQEWLSGTDALLLGVVVGAVAPLGDLFESYIKRDVGTKDTGRAFGAHGGALDRLDAVLFTAVAGYYTWRALLG